jgi:hypothetical protein
MADGKMSHHWDMFAPLICFTANPHLPKKKRITEKEIHPFFEKRQRKPKPFHRGNWLWLKEKVKMK